MSQYQQPHEHVVYTQEQQPQQYAQQYPPQQYATPQVYTEAQPLVYASTTNDAQFTKDEETAKLLFFVGFLIGILWIVNFIMHRKSPNPQAQKYARWSIIAWAVIFIACMCLSILGVVLQFVIIAAAK